MCLSNSLSPEMRNIAIPHLIMRGLFDGKLNPENRRHMRLGLYAWPMESSPINPYTKSRCMLSSIREWDSVLNN